MAYSPLRRDRRIPDERFYQVPTSVPSARLMLWPRHSPLVNSRYCVLLASIFSSYLKSENAQPLGPTSGIKPHLWL